MLNARIDARDAVLDSSPSARPSVDPGTFIGALPPFDRLAADERARVVNGLTATRFEAGETILRHLQPARSFFLIVSGVVEELDGAGVVATFGAGTGFDARALLQGRAENRFVARSRCLAYEMAGSLFLALVRGSDSFRDYYSGEIARRSEAIVAIQQQREAASFLMTRLGESRLHPAPIVAAETTIGEAARMMEHNDATAVLVRRGDAIGIFTDRDLRERHVLMSAPVGTAIGDLASYDLQTLDHEDFLFNALVLMSSRSIRHIPVTREGRIVGVFEQADFLRALSNSSSVIASQLERAQGEPAIRAAGMSIPGVIRSLYERGVKPRYMTRIVTDLNRKLFAKVFENLAGPEERANACLIVMGSEGRGEQLVRTDQDNGLILNDDAPAPGIDETAAAFSRTLEDLGYPPCQGGVMVTNPAWRKPVSEYRTDVRRWVSQPTGEGFLTLAILYDAAAISGDGSLLDAVKSTLLQLMHSEEAFIGHFAKATLSFPTPLNWLGRIATERADDGRNLVDVKKGGVFPLVHGVRSLALERRISETNTIGRIQAMSGRGPFSDEFTADLIEAFDFLSMVRMRQQFIDLDEGRALSNLVDVDRLSSLERGLLRDSFKIVRGLKSYIVEHFRLQLLT